MEKEFNGFPSYMDFMAQQGIEDPMFNPVAQYEQAYVYYKYLCMQMDYKIKCKEYEKMCSNSNLKNTTEKKSM